MNTNISGPNGTAQAGAYIMNLDALLEGRFAFDVGELKRWLETMHIGKRIIVAHRTRVSDECAAYWLAHGFEIVLAGADNDNVPTVVMNKVSGTRRVFVATSPSDLVEWHTALAATPVFVACIRKPDMEIRQDIKKRAAAIYWMQRFLFPVPPALAVAA